MSEAIYKSGQGYWTRMMSAAAFGLLVIQGSWWIWQQWGSGARTPTGTYIGGGAALLFMAVMAALMWVYLGRNQRTVDFLIATEGEMKKVNWSTRREIFGSTGVVIFVMFSIAVFCFVCDRVFAFLFLQIGVLDNSVLDAGK